MANFNLKFTNRGTKNGRGSPEVSLRYLLQFQAINAALRLFTDSNKVSVIIVGHRIEFFKLNINVAQISFNN